MRLDSSASSLQCGRPRSKENPTMLHSGTMTAEVKRFLQQQGQKSRPEVWAKTTGLRTGCVTRPEGTTQCNYLGKLPQSHLVKILKICGKLTAASCRYSWIIITTLDRKAFKNTIKWLAEVRVHTAAGIAIGESEGENCFSTHSCTTAFILKKLIMWQEATNRNVKHHSLLDNGKASLQ